MTYRENMGRAPRECTILDQDGNFAGWRSVHVILFNGFDSAKAGHAPWPAGGRMPPTVWRISQPAPHPFEIEKWKLA